VRILLASDFYHPAIGGAERQVRLLAAALAARGHDVRVATVRQPGQAVQEILDGVAVLRLPSLAARLRMAGSSPGRRFVPPMPDPLLLAAVRGALDSTPVDLVHASGWIAYSCAAALSGLEAPLLLSVRDYGYSCAVRSLLWHDRRVCDGPAPAKCLDCAGRRYGAARGLASVGGVLAGRSLLKRHVRGIHSVSAFVEGIVRRDLLADAQGWDPVLERIPDIVPELPDADAEAVLQPDAEAVLQEEDRAVLAALPEEPFILFVGALHRFKGLRVLLDAYGILRTMAPGAGVALPPLVLIGTRDPDTPSRLPDGVTLLADVPHAAVMAAWGRCLFGVAPSIWPDPLPGVVREPMTRGRPVIASRVGGIPDMVSDGVNGLLVPPGDADALAQAMLALLADPALRTRLGEAARASVAECTAPAVAAAFESFYARAVAA
jgi:glycosyltransferase involved in cell wall biosynthesis